VAFSPIPLKFTCRGVISGGKAMLARTFVPVSYFDVGPHFQEALKAARAKKQVDKLPDRDLQFQVVGAYREGLTQAERATKDDVLCAAGWTLICRGKKQGVLPRPAKYSLLLRLDPSALQSDNPEATRLRQAFDEQARIRLMVKVTPNGPKALPVPLIVDLCCYYEEC
jgi:hypothetical protein